MLVGVKTTVPLMEPWPVTEPSVIWFVVTEPKADLMYNGWAPPLLVSLNVSPNEIVNVGSFSPLIM